jgi:hypothetical protein
MCCAVRGRTKPAQSDQRRHSPRRLPPPLSRMPSAPARDARLAASDVPTLSGGRRRGAGLPAVQPSAPQPAPIATRTDRTGDPAMSATDDRCASRGCTRLLTGGKAVIVTRDGRRYCKHHGDRLPRFLRRQPRIPKPLTDARARPGGGRHHEARRRGLYTPVESVESVGNEGTDSPGFHTSNTSHTTSNCAVCGEPMTLVEVGQTTHPNCERTAP